MHFSTLIYNLALMSSAGLAQYVLEDDYFGNGNFYSMFSFWNQPDPTHGFVNYLAESDAYNANLIYGGGSWGVDNTTVTSSGRNSIRLTSNKAYSSGLVIVDIAHMPGGICGTWPAFWMVGPNWPYDGEIDIVEGVNDQSQNDMTLHSGPSCSITNNGQFSGTLTQNTDCNSSNGNNNGCQIQDQSTNSYGTGFNNNGGGVYATEITSSAITIWFFPRGSIPSDVESDSPNPSGWGTPIAMFQGGCNIPSSFQQLQIVFDTTFCGDWAGNTWSNVGSCAATTQQSCTGFVGNNPSAFTDAYWTVNSLKTYQPGNSNAAPAVEPSSSAAAPQPTSAAPIPASSSAAAAPAPTPTSSLPWSQTGNGWVGSGDLTPSSVPAAAVSPAAPAASQSPQPWSVTGSGWVGSGDLTPSSADQNSGSGELASSAALASPTGVPANGGSNAANPGSPSNNDNGGYHLVSGSNGVISEHMDKTRRARLERHIRAHKSRHGSRF